MGDEGEPLWLASLDPTHLNSGHLGKILRPKTPIKTKSVLSSQVNCSCLF
jgi:hypothetical protein